MRRIYFLLPDKATATAVVQDLEAKGLPESHLHVIASLSQGLEGLPEATIWQKTELAHGIEWGLGLGSVAGFLGGFLAMTYPPPGLLLGWGSVAVATAAGTGIGVLMTAVIASHQHNRTIDDFEAAIERGELLLMVDLPRKQMRDVQQLIKSHFPRVRIGVGKSPHI